MTNFRFEKLLKLRETERNDAKNVFLEAESRRRAAQSRLQELEDEVVAEREETRRARETNALTAPTLQARQRYRDQLRQARDSAQETLAALEAEVEEKRDALTNAVKEVKILENLRDKMLERELEEAKRKEEKAVDDLANQLESVERQRNSREE